MVSHLIERLLWAGSYCSLEIQRWLGHGFEALSDWGEQDGIRLLGSPMTPPHHNLVGGTRCDGDRGP